MTTKRRSTGPAREDDLVWEVRCTDCNPKPGSWLSRAISEEIAVTNADLHLIVHPTHVAVVRHRRTGKKTKRK